METPLHWIPCKWRIAGGDRRNEVAIVAVAGANRPDRYVIRRGDEVMSRKGEWEHEPSPSSREADFLSRTRFASVCEAAELFEQHAE